jgi:hypothetical protein
MKSSKQVSTLALDRSQVVHEKSFLISFPRFPRTCCTFGAFSQLNAQAAKAKKMFLHISPSATKINEKKNTF